MFVERSLTLESASLIVDAALAEAVAKKLNPVCIVVLDSGGVPVAMKSQNGCGILRYDVAIAKAFGALGMGTSGRDLQIRLHDRPNFSAALSSVSQGKFVPNPGGVLIANANGNAIGAVGISGDTSNNDDDCAVAAIAAAGLLSFPTAD